MICSNCFHNEGLRLEAEKVGEESEEVFRPLQIHHWSKDQAGRKCAIADAKLFHAWFGARTLGDGHRILVDR